MTAQKTTAKWVYIKSRIAEHNGKMFKFHLKIIYPINNQEELKLNEKYTNNRAKIQMKELVELPDKDLQAQP